MRKPNGGRAYTDRVCPQRKYFSQHGVWRQDPKRVCDNPSPGLTVTLLGCQSHIPITPICELLQERVHIPFCNRKDVPGNAITRLLEEFCCQLTYLAFFNECVNFLTTFLNAQFCAGMTQFHC